MLGGVILSAYVLARAGVYLLIFWWWRSERGRRLALNRIFKENPKLHTYGDIAREAYGPIAERILSVTQFLDCSDAVLLVLSQRRCYWCHSSRYNSRSLIMTVCLIVVLPATWCKTLRPLAALSSLVSLCFGSVCFLIKGAWMPLSSDQDFTSRNTWYYKGGVTSWVHGLFLRSSRHTQ